MLDRLMPTVRVVALAALAASQPVQAAVTTLDFEVGAPCQFIHTSPLTSLGGVSFTGLSGSGGSILDECGNFGIDARSGKNFYALNTQAGTGTVVDLGFGGPIDLFSIWASGGSGVATFRAEAFLGPTLLFGVEESSAVAEYVELELSGGAFDRVQLSFGGHLFAVFDDLSFGQAPEPLTVALLGLGFALATIGARAARGEVSRAWSGRRIR